MKVQISPLTVHDLSAVASLLSSIELFQTYGMTYDKALRTCEKHLNNSNAQQWICSLNNSICGYALVLEGQAFGNSSYLKLIATIPTKQNQGIGRQLINHIEENCSASDLFLLVSEHNLKAQKFYASLGYQQVGLIPDYVKRGFNEAIFYKRIKIEII